MKNGIRTLGAEIVVAAMFFAVGAIVVYDSRRLGSSWGSDGPESGYFPFYIGLIVCIASLVNFVLALRSAKPRETVFVEPEALRTVLKVLIPAAVYVLAVQFLGIYVASVVYIAAFMAVLGGYRWITSAALATAVMAGFFAMFEIWFKVPLHKGDLNPLALVGL